MNLTDRYLKIAVKSPESRCSSSEYDLGALKACRYSRIVVIQIVVISEVKCIQLDGTLLWAWKFGRYWRIVVISAVVISEVDCTSCHWLVAGTHILYTHTVHTGCTHNIYNANKMRNRPRRWHRGCSCNYSKQKTMAIVHRGLYLRLILIGQQ